MKDKICIYHLEKKSYFTPNKDKEKRNLCWTKLRNKSILDQKKEIYVDQKSLYWPKKVYVDQKKKGKEIHIKKNCINLFSILCIMCTRLMSCCGDEYNVSSIMENKISMYHLKRKPYFTRNKHKEKRNLCWPNN